MATNIKKTSVSGRVPNTFTLSADGDIGINTHDGKLWVSNGSVVFEIGAGGGGTGVPGGLDTQIQFNDSNQFAGDAGLTYNKTTDALTIAGSVLVGANVIANTSALFVGNSSVNSVITSDSASLGNTTITGFANVSSTIQVGANVVANTSTLLIGNSSVNTIISSTTIQFSDNTIQKTAWNGTEKFSSKTSATGVVEHDCTNNAVFYHTSISANFTANVTNLTIPINTVGFLTLILAQGATPRTCNALQINGSAQTINWQASTVAPPGYANKIDIVTFSIMRTGASTYIVFGQMVSFG
jgi:hypothetical protein